MTELNDCVLSSGSELFIFPIMAGTALYPLQDILSRSQFHYEELPVRMLNASHLAEIIVNEQWWKKEWFDSEVANIFYDYCRIPRLAETFLKLVQAGCGSSDVIPRDNLQEIKRQLDKQIYQKTESIGDLAEQIISDIILQRGIRRNQLVSEIKPGSCTYGDLENKGAIIIGSRPEISDKCFVECPFPLLRMMVEQVRNKSDSMQLLHTILNSFRSERMEWQNFEQFCQKYLAVKEMLLREAGALTIQLKELYRGAVGPTDVLERQVQLSSSVKFHKCTHQIKKDYPDNLAFDEYPTYTFLNKDGATFDGFCDRDRLFESGTVERHRIVMQYKLWRRCKVSLDVVEAEARKVSDALPAGVDGFNYTLVIITTNCVEITAEDVPANCLVLSGKNLQQYFGDVISSNVVGSLPSECVYVNGDDAERLQTVPGFGDKTAAKVIEERKKSGPFADWDAFKRRVSRVTM